MDEQKSSKQHRREVYDFVEGILGRELELMERTRLSTLLKQYVNGLTEKQKVIITHQQKRNGDLRSEIGKMRKKLQEKR